MTLTTRNYIIWYRPCRTYAYTALGCWHRTNGKMKRTKKKYHKLSRIKATKYIVRPRTLARFCSSFSVFFFYYFILFPFHLVVVHFPFLFHSAGEKKNISFHISFGFVCHEFYLDFHIQQIMNNKTWSMFLPRLQFKYSNSNTVTNKTLFRSRENKKIYHGIWSNQVKKIVTK